MDKELQTTLNEGIHKLKERSLLSEEIKGLVDMLVREYDEASILDMAPSNIERELTDKERVKLEKLEHQGLMAYYRLVCAVDKNERKMYLRTLRATILSCILESNGKYGMRNFRYFYNKASDMVEGNTGKSLLYPDMYQCDDLTDNEKLELLRKGSIAKTKDFLCKRGYLKVEKPGEIFEDLRVTEKGKEYIKRFGN